MLWSISETVNARIFKPLPIVFSTPENILEKNFWSSRNERKPLSKQKCVLRKCCGVSQKRWMLELSNLCHCVQHPWKHTRKDFWSSRNERKPLSKQKCVLRKCCGVSAGTWWMLELSNLCHYVQHPWKHTRKDFWSSRNERKPLSKQKCVLRQCCGVSQKWWMLELSNLCHYLQHPWKLTSRDFWSSKNERKPLSKQKCVLRKCCGVSQKWWMLELSNLCHCVQHPWKHTRKDFWSSRNERKPLSKAKNVFWENAVGCRRNSEC